MTDNLLDQFELADDGTMDTVIRCRACGAEARFNFGIECDMEEDSETAYDEFVDECRADMADTHDCQEDAE